MNISRRLLWLTLFLYPFHQFLKMPELRVANSYYIGISILFILACFAIISAPRRYGLNILDVLLLLFGISYLVSTILSEDPMRSAYLGFRIIFIPLASYFVIKTFVERREDVEFLLKALLYGISLYVFIGLVMSATALTRGGILGMTPVGASNIALISFMMVMFSDYRHSIWGKLVALASVALIYITYSRMSYMSLFLSLPLMILIRRGHVTKIFIVLFPALLMVSILLPLNREFLRHTYVPPANMDTLARVTDISSYKRSMLERADQLNIGLRDFYISPVLGVGIKEGAKRISIHNYPVEWLQSGGVIGCTIGFLSFLSFFILQRRTSTTDQWTPIFLGLFLLTILNAFTNGILHGIRVDLVYMFMGLCEAQRKVLLREQSEVQSEDAY